MMEGSSRMARSGKGSGIDSGSCGSLEESTCILDTCYHLDEGLDHYKCPFPHLSESAKGKSGKRRYLDGL